MCVLAYFENTSVRSDPVIMNSTKDPDVYCRHSIKTYALILLLILVLYLYITHSSDMETGSPNIILPGHRINHGNRYQNTTQHKNELNRTLLPSCNNHFICPLFVCNSCGLGNKIFLFASAYGIALRQNMTLVLTRQDLVTQVFEISDKTNIKILNNRNLCKTAKLIREANGCCTFDPRFVNLDCNMDYRVTDYLLSWRYFDGFEKQIRSQLVFKSYLEAQSKRFIEKTASHHGYKSRSDVAVIGIHVRRGDMTLDYKQKRGYNVATREYFQQAINLLSKTIENPILFIIATNDHIWVRNNIVLNVNLQNYTFETVGSFTAEVDFAILSHCDHVITSVGTFGWWTAWIANGITTYYKWPAQPNTFVGNQYNTNFTDFFYSSWIGLS